MVCSNHSREGQGLEDMTYFEEAYQKPHLKTYQRETTYLFIFSEASHVHKCSRLSH